MSLVDQTAHHGTVGQVVAEQQRYPVEVGVPMDHRHLALAVLVGNGNHVSIHERVVATNHNRDHTGVDYLPDQMMDGNGGAFRRPVVDNRVTLVDDLEFLHEIDIPDYRMRHL